MAAHCSGCVFTVCVCVHCCVCAFTAVCVHFGWVKCRAQFRVWVTILGRMSLHFHFQYGVIKIALFQKGLNNCIVQESPGEREVTRWSSHSEAMLQASLDDVDWDMFRASSADVSEFTDVALSFVNMLTDQATETVTIRTFSNQKPWVDSTIRAAVNQRTAAYNAGPFIRKHVRVQNIVLCSPTGS